MKGDMYMIPISTRIYIAVDLSTSTIRVAGVSDRPKAQPLSYLLHQTRANEAQDPWDETYDQLNILDHIWDSSRHDYSTSIFQPYKSPTSASH